MMKYYEECMFIIEQIKDAYSTYSTKKISIEDKAAFDLVTTLDRNIEQYIAQKIRQRYPNDIIQGEEYTQSCFSTKRFWTIDPIDGTVNMANGIPLFGVQCALVAEQDVVTSAIYFPFSNSTLWAVKGMGSYCNSERIYVNSSINLDHGIVSFGDYSHKKSNPACNLQHSIISIIYPQVAKIRMFGAACIDFALVALGKTHATVVCTKNLWDIAPGILLCKEAGAILTNCKGENYQLGDDGVVACATTELSQTIINAYTECNYQ